MARPVPRVAIVDADLPARREAPRTHDERMQQQERQQQQMGQQQECLDGAAAMLSRIAESFFWIGRYVERAHSTARLLAEHHQLMVEDRTVAEVDACSVLLEALSLPDEKVQTGVDLVRRVMGGGGQRSTVAGSVAAARENARSVRDVLSGEVFEALNSTHLSLTRGIAYVDSPGVSYCIE